ncbi:CD209 [Branchiostoma lanceolatum]|uniref:CD209 protein n=1 Tax=Branchiostoma lanceolatum TaxID=7740 RepID=A0A8J9W1G1_BRALA|nr:CD209 [Branchiostoma lanceolatum]
MEPHFSNTRHAVETKRTGVCTGTKGRQNKEILSKYGYVKCLGTMAEITLLLIHQTVSHRLTIRTNAGVYSGTTNQLTVDIFSDVCDDVCATSTVSGLTVDGTEYDRDFAASNFGDPSRLRLTASGDDMLRLDWIDVYNAYTGRYYRFTCNGCQLSTNPSKGSRQLDLDVDVCFSGYQMHRDTCYKAFNTPKNFHDAASTCAADGGTLAMPKDADTNAFLINLKNAVDNNTLFRFGLTDRHQEGGWIWDDNVTLGSFTAWGPGQPDNYGDEDCAEYFSGSHSSHISDTWNDGPCTHADRMFICQVTPSEIDACFNNPCDAQATCTDNSAPALDANCTCNAGYTGDGLANGTGCSDNDACTDDPCDAQATCTDNPAPALDANCTCNDGYTGDGLANGTGCSDNDACTDDPCDAQATCTDNPAPALDANCTCNDGYTGDGLASGTGCSEMKPCSFVRCSRPRIESLLPEGQNSVEVDFRDHILAVDDKLQEMTPLLDAASDVTYPITNYQVSPDKEPSSAGEYLFPPARFTVCNDTCEFSVIIKDSTAPQLSSCPSSHHHLQGDSCRDVNVFDHYSNMTMASWFRDNVGIKDIHCKQPTVDIIAPGETASVTCQAKDKVGNPSDECTITFYCQKQVCPPLTPPEFGAFVCHADQQERRCALFCTEGKFHARPLEDIFKCDLNSPSPTWTGANVDRASCSGVATDGGRDPRVPLDSYRPPQAGQPPANKWQGKGSNEPREHGVGFAVKNTLLRMMEPGSNGSARLLTLRLNTTKGPITLVSVYAPTLAATPEVKDEFYENLTATIRNIPSDEQLVLLGDFNARVGDDHESWPACLRKFGVGKMNENGQRALEFCAYHNLCITNSYFQTKPQHKVSWRHPRSKHWHQLDLILTRRTSLKNVLLTRAYQSADCDTDHSLVCCKFKMEPKKFHHARQPGKPRIDISRMAQPDLVEKFTVTFEKEVNSKPSGLSATKKWNDLRDVMHRTAMATFGKKTTQSHDWFDAKSAEMAPVIEAKRAALAEYKRTPSERNLHVLRAARNKVKQTARRCANEYWSKLSEDIHVAAITGNIRGMYDGIKRALGPTQSKTAPLKSTTGEEITDKKLQMERWVEHYSDLYSRQNTVSPSALDAIECLPTMDELDAEPTLDGLNKAIDSLSTGKAPGSDAIPPDLLKHCKTVLLLPLHELLCQCWKEGAVPQDMRDSKIVTLYKNKGERSDCNNYRGISLLSVVGKVYAKVVLARLQRLAERVYPESQCGFRANRSTIDMIFSLRQLQEKCREQNMPLYIAFIDLTKAFDMVSRDGLFKILPKIGCPPKLQSLIESFHTNMKGTVLYSGNLSEPFDIRGGVKQGCVLAPTLFGIFFALLLKQAFGTATEGIYLRTRSDGRLFNLNRLKAKTKVRESLIRDLLFADDAGLAAHTEQGLQSLMDRFSRACNDFGLIISLKKTEVLGQDVEAPPAITIGDYELKAVNHFTYLGSTASNNLSLDKEIDKRIGKAATTLARLTTRVWENPKLSVKTKMAVYNACVLSTLLYGSETWSTYAKQENRLNAFHMRCMRRILGISWKDKVTNTEVLSRAGLPTLFTLLRQRRLRWLGHVRRMEDGRIPKDLLYGELISGKRRTGRPQLRFKDVCKRDLKAIDINTEHWEDLASDRSRWRCTLFRQLKSGEVRLMHSAEEKRIRRKELCNRTESAYRYKGRHEQHFTVNMTCAPNDEEFYREVQQTLSDTNEGHHLCYNTSDVNCDITVSCANVSGQVTTTPVSTTLTTTQSTTDQTTGSITAVEPTTKIRTPTSTTASETSATQAAFSSQPSSNPQKTPTTTTTPKSPTTSKTTTSDKTTANTASPTSTPTATHFTPSQTAKTTGATENIYKTTSFSTTTRARPKGKGHHKFQFPLVPVIATAAVLTVTFLAVVVIIW